MAPGVQATVAAMDVVADPVVSQIVVFFSDVAVMGVLISALALLPVIW